MVLDEVARGDPKMATRRLEILCDFPLLEVNEAVQDLVAQFITKSNLPSKAAESCTSHCCGYSFRLKLSVNLEL